MRRFEWLETTQDNYGSPRHEYVHFARGSKSRKIHGCLQRTACTKAAEISTVPFARIWGKIDEYQIDIGSEIDQDNVILAEIPAILPANCLLGHMSLAELLEVIGPYG